MSGRQIMACVAMVGMAPWIAGWLGYYVCGDWALVWRISAMTTLCLWLPTWLLAGLLLFPADAQGERTPWARLTSTARATVAHASRDARMCATLRYGEDADERCECLCHEWDDDDEDESARAVAAPGGAE